MFSVQMIGNVKAENSHTKRKVEIVLLFTNEIRLISFCVSEKNRIGRKCSVGGYVLEKWIQLINRSTNFSKIMKTVSRYVVV